MITRFPGLTPTRSRAVVHDDLVMTVAVAPDPVTSSMYEQTAKALARIDESLALCGSDKSKILSAIVYISDMKRKERDEPRLGRMGRHQESADARLPRRRTRTAAYRGDRGDGGEVSRSCHSGAHAKREPGISRFRDAQIAHLRFALRAPRNDEDTQPQHLNTPP